VFEPEALPAFDPERVEDDAPGLWRYRHWLPSAEGRPPLWLGEGRTPLVPTTVDGLPVWCKLESLNPSGSFKDRGSAILVAWLRERGVLHAVEDSSGNAGASFAAYCAAAGIAATIYVPAHAAGAKLAQIESYGASLVRVAGPREAAAREAGAAAAQGAAYGSHVYLPFGLYGIATLAFELVEALGRAPRAIVLPAGHGTLTTGLWLGFGALLAGQSITRPPRFILAQAEACAPVYQAWSGGGESIALANAASRAEGIMIREPVRLRTMLQAVSSTGGRVTRVSESEIEAGRNLLGRAGISAEPTSAVVVAGLRQAMAAGILGSNDEGEVVVIISGHGLKSS
jgi:threonine synthase